MIWLKLNLVILFTIISSTLAASNIASPHYFALEARGDSCPGGGSPPCVCKTDKHEGMGIRKGTLKCPEKAAIYRHDDTARDGRLEYVDVGICNLIHDSWF
jgi:hypothetical protein